MERRRQGRQDICGRQMFELHLPTKALSHYLQRHALAAAFLILAFSPSPRAQPWVKTETPPGTVRQEPPLLQATAPSHPDGARHVQRATQANLVPSYLFETALPRRDIQYSAPNCRDRFEFSSTYQSATCQRYSCKLFVYAGTFNLPGLAKTFFITL